MTLQAPIAAPGHIARNHCCMAGDCRHECTHGCTNREGGWLQTCSRAKETARAELSTVQHFSLCETASLTRSRSSATDCFTSFTNSWLCCCDVGSDVPASAAFLNGDGLPSPANTTAWAIPACDQTSLTALGCKTKKPYACLGEHG